MENTVSSSDTPDDPPTKKLKLSKSTIAVIERKRQNAILLRESRLKYSQDYSKPNYQNKKTVPHVTQCTLKPLTEKAPSSSTELFDPVFCRECKIQCNASYLYDMFRENVCDDCKSKDKDQFKLMSRTEAKNEFSLKDCDLDAREPPLRYVTAPNPHSTFGGIMKLYMQGQVYERACMVHGGDEGIDEVLKQKTINRETAMQRRLDKKLSELRKNSKQRKPKEVHVHEYGVESYDSDDDEYSHTCLSCGYSEKYEKM